MLMMIAISERVIGSYPPFPRDDDAHSSSALDIQAKKISPMVLSSALAIFAIVAVVIT